MGALGTNELTFSLPGHISEYEKFVFTFPLHVFPIPLITTLFVYKQTLIHLRHWDQNK